MRYWFSLDGQLSARVSECAKERKIAKIVIVVNWSAERHCELCVSVTLFYE